MKKNYVGFARSGSVFGPATGQGEYVAKLPPGHYKLDYNDDFDILNLTAFTPNTDEILNIGGKEFNYAFTMAERFLAPDAELAYAKQGYLYKRSFMFYGPPGTGKSVLACKISDLAVARKNAIAIYPSSYTALERFLEVMTDTDKGRFVTIVLEEFDSLLNHTRDGYWTTLLDGQFQTSNRLIVANTNHIERINKRMLRPGRFSSILNIPAMNHASLRDTYLKSKNVGDDKLRKKIVELTDGFTIDELKEVIQGGVMLGNDIDLHIAGIRAAKELGSSGSASDDDDE